MFIALGFGRGGGGERGERERQEVTSPLRSTAQGYASSPCGMPIQPLRYRAPEKNSHGFEDFGTEDVGTRMVLKSLVQPF